MPSFTLYKEFSAQHTSTTDTIFELDFNSDDTRLITCAKDGHINQYNLVTDINQWKSPLDIGKDVLACKFADNDKIGAYCDG